MSDEMSDQEAQIRQEQRADEPWYGSDVPNFDPPVMYDPFVEVRDLALTHLEKYGNFGIEGMPPIREYLEMSDVFVEYLATGKLPDER
jgi:hypothetical protein